MSGHLSYKAEFTPPQSESQAMRTYALESGLPADAVLVEDESKDTLGNAYFTKVRIVVPRQLGRLAVIMSPNHSRERVEYIFRKVFGQSYDISYVGHDIIREEEADREQQSLDIVRSWLDEVADGDHDSVYQVMRTKHPGYKD
jgi:uncharacterized SAM-binding protein YcdF (DUF218 family)